MRVRRQVFCVVVRPVYFLGLLACLLAQPARAAAPLHAHLPADTLMFIEIDPTAMGQDQAPGKSSGSLFDLGVQTMSDLGVMPKEAGVVTNLLRLGGAVGQRRACAAWLD